MPHFGAEEQAQHEAEEKGEHIGQKLKKALLTGVSYMIPFVAGGGLLIALGFLMGGYLITKYADTIVVQNSLFNLPTEFPDNAWGPLAPTSARCCSRSAPCPSGSSSRPWPATSPNAIADRPGIAPGFVAGAVAGFMGAGFLGGIVGGLLAGYVAS